MVNRYSTPHLDLFIAQQKEVWKRHPEYTVLSRVWKAFKNADNPIKFVDDGEELNPVDNKQEFWYQVLNLDEFYLLTESGQFVRIVMGNDWDCLIDYSGSVEDIVKPVNDYIDKHN